jgi:dihydropteroate synthase
VAEHGAPVVLMHQWSRAEKKERADFLGDIIQELRAQIESATEAGIRTEQLIIDPGLGFGKTVGQNLEILNRLGEFKSLGLPILIGPSRKGFISRTIDAPVDEREEGTAAAIALGITRGADLIRAHDVKAMARVARMTDAMVRDNRKQDPSHK